MNQIPFLEGGNFTEIVKAVDFADTGELLDVLEDMIDHAPFASRITSQFISEAISRNSELEESLRNTLQKTPDDRDAALSRCIYAAYLGAKTNLPSIEAVSSVFASLTVECNELTHFDNQIDVFYCHSLLKELKCNKRECLFRLSTLPHDCVIDHIVKNQDPFNVSMIVLLCRFFGFLISLEKRLPEFKMKNEIVASIVINHFSELGAFPENLDAPNGIFGEERAVLRRLITGETLEYCLKVCNKYFLGLLLDTRFDDPQLPRISRKRFEETKFSGTADFLKAFIELTSPSVSHFLSYLEFYKDRFKLSEEEKRLFVDLLKDFHKQNPAYLDIVLGKLQKFGLAC